MSKKHNLICLINKAKTVHNNKYTYDLLLNYINMNQKQNINCPIHGVFKQSLKEHINKGKGCNRCSIDNKRDTNKSFIITAIKKHNTFYDYSLINYINSKTKIIII